MLISLVEYAEKLGKDSGNARRMAAAGRFKTAVKLGRNWVIDSDEQWPDARTKTGKYKNWRKPKEKTEE